MSLKEMSFDDNNILYHGSYTSVSSPEIIITNRTKDFGDGFYCTVLKKQAIRWAKRFQTPILNLYTLDTTGMHNFKVLDFKSMTEEWLDFIIDCRSGKKHNYDIVIGPIADDQIYNYISDYLSGILTREQFWVLAKFKYPTNQILFANKESLKLLKFIESTRC